MAATSPDRNRQLTLVPNRLALDLFLAEHHDAAGGPLAFVGPPAQILSRWAERLYRRSAMLAGESFHSVPAHFLLQRLWERVITRDTPDWLPADRSAFATQAMDAERLLWHWADGQDEFAGSATWNRFRNWRRRVHRVLDARGWFSAEQCLAHLIESLHEPGCVRDLLPGEIHLRGFAELTELEKRLLDTLGQAGVQLSMDSPPEAAAVTMNGYIMANPDEEARFAARWARARIEEGKRRVALVVNALPLHRARLQRALEDEFCAARMLGFSAAGQAPFRLHPGEPLRQHPLVAGALKLLQIGIGGQRRQHDFERLSRFLLNPAWTAAGEERFERGLLEHRLRERGVYRCSLARLADLAGELPAPVLQEKIACLPARAKGQAAVEFLAELLRHWEWPGPSARDAAAERAVRQFAGLLESVTLAEPEGVQDALALLQRLCNEQTQRPAGGAMSPVQVLSPESACARRFDATLLLDLQADSWPASPQFNPLLPAAVNRTIPRAGANGQLAYDRKLLRLLDVGAGEIVCSRSEMTDGFPTRSSPLLQVVESAPESARHDSLAMASFPAIHECRGLVDHPWLQARQADCGPSLTGETNILRGAVTVLSLQAACPLAAFLVTRLGARFADPPSPFPGPEFSGTVVHRALERLYRPHLGSDSRPAGSEVSAAVDAALDHCHAGLRMPPLILAVECERLASLLHEWLISEQTQTGGCPVQLEHTLEVNWAGFELHTRIDRIDRLPGGGLLVIDYKTGTPETLGWAVPRLGQPQLPLYAVLLQTVQDEPVSGVALAKVRPGEVGLRGLCDDGEAAGPGITGVGRAHKPLSGLGDWPSALESWSFTLSGLLDEYAAGDCRHQLFDEDGLKYLGLEPLLRHASLQAWQAARRDAGNG